MYEEKGDTWPKILKYNYERYSDRHKAMRYKDFGIWHHYTWEDYYFGVKYLALGLLSLGFEYGDRVLIIGDNAPQWYCAELATQANHGVSIGVYADSKPKEIKYFAENSKARFAVVQDQEQVDKLFEIREEIPNVNKIIFWNYKGLAHYHDPILMGHREVLRLGKDFETKNSGVFERNIEAGKAEDICTIVYTSGTCGSVPKGAVHTYKSIRSSVDHLLHLDPWSHKDNVVLQSPPVGINEQWLGIGCHLLSASILNFAEGPETQRQDYREIGPDIIFYGPRLWENQAAAIQARIQDADGISRFWNKILMPVGFKAAESKYYKRNSSILFKIRWALAYFILFRQIRDNLGLTNARICYTGGAMLSTDTFRFYHALNIPLKSIYGSTEGGALSCAKTNDIKPETVGTIYKGVEVRITSNGEITWRYNGLFSGYHNCNIGGDTLNNGWFCSGDAGLIADEGHIVFQERLVDFVQMANGGKLSPQFVESRLKCSPYIKDAWVMTGPGRTYASAILVISYDRVGKWAGQRRLTYANFTELSQREEVYQLMRQEIERINITLPLGSRVKKWVNLHKEFDPDEAELTRDRKLRRTFLEERYSQIISAIYDDKPEVTLESQIRHRDGRMGVLKTLVIIKSVEGADL